MDERAQFIGKYEQTGRIGGALINGFYGAIAAMVADLAADAETVLEVGAGDGYSTPRLRAMFGSAVAFVSSELSLPGVGAVRARNPQVPVIAESVYALAHADAAFDVVFCLEVLEHLDDPAQALRELARVSRGAVILSVPREPLWRALNMARGKYWGDWGNTPGHLQHWSSRRFVRLVSQELRPLAVRQPLPWTVIAARRTAAR